MSLASVIASSLDDIPGEERDAIIKELRTGVLRELAIAKVNQEKIRQQTEILQKRKSIDGIGRLRMSIDPSMYHYWGQTVGYDCWKDNQFLREIERDNESVRINCGGTRLQVGFTGEKRSKKVYA